MKDMEVVFLQKSFWFKVNRLSIGNTRLPETLKFIKKSGEATKIYEARNWKGYYLISETKVGRLHYV